MCLQPSPLRRHLVNFGSYEDEHSQILFLERVFEKEIYYVFRGDVFGVTLNVLLHDVTKHVFLSCSIDTEMFCGLYSYDVFLSFQH